MENTQQLTADNSDTELMDRFESLRRQACGEPIGDQEQTPTEAVGYEGWMLIRALHQGTNSPGTPVLAQDAAGRLWIVNDLDGPWAIQIAEVRK